MDKKTMNALIKALEQINKPQNQKAYKENFDGLGWWQKKFDFKVQQKGLKIKCSNGKTYPAVKGITKDGKELTLVATRGGNVYQKKF